MHICTKNVVENTVFLFLQITPHSEPITLMILSNRILILQMPGSPGPKVSEELGHRARVCVPLFFLSGFYGRSVQVVFTFLP